MTAWTRHNEEGDVRAGTERAAGPQAATGWAGDDVLPVARDLAGELRADSASIEAARRLPERWVEAFSRHGLFQLCVPRSLGGAEAHPRVLVETIATLAAGDGSAAWCVMIAATTSVLGGWLAAEPARRIFAAPRAVSGGVFAPSGRARRVPGGFQMSGRWTFASGCQHATWLLGGCLVEGDAGLEQAPGGRPDVRLLLFPAGEAEVIDTWDVAGLCGTGSHDIAVRDLFVPEEHTVSFLSGAPRERRPLYAFPVFGLLALGVASVGLGLGRRALDEVTALARDKTPALAQKRLAERATTQVQVAEGEALLGSARAWLLESVERCYEAAASGGPLPVAERARLRLAASHAAESAARAVHIAYTLGGGSSLYRRSPLQRLFRDAHVVTQHASVSGGSRELVGRALLGVETDLSLL
jgi:alkylation response protein AidB-like acyl-CoA dehydrogenase